ncbi:MAG: adenosylhomocysteinase [Microbacteriaceae bacterium]|nr:adenosylhomocysteinase [Microbacteriaceae bacterium]
MTLHEEGAQKIAWARQNMPLLAGLRVTFERELPLAGRTVAMGLHVESKTAVLAELLVAGGASLTMTGSPGTTDDAVAEALRQDLGIRVLGQRSDSYADQLEHVKESLATKPDLIVDNGADLIAAVIESGQGGVFAATEETMSGALRLRGELSGRVPFPVIVVNDSPLKLIVENEKGIGPAVLDGFNRATNTIVAGRTFALFGYGTVGRSMARTLRADNATVLLVETDPIRALEAALDGMLVMPIEQALPLADVVITLTGRPGIVRAEHFGLLRDGVMLANVGHFSTEIDVDALRSAATSETVLAPHVVQYDLPTGKSVRLLARGEMLNLAAATGHAIEVMDVGFALQGHSVHALATRLGDFIAGDQLVPHSIDLTIATDILKTMPAARWAE